MKTTMTKGLLLVTLIALFVQGCKDAPKETITGTTSETIYTKSDKTDIEYYQRLTDLSRYTIVKKVDGYWAYVQTSKYNNHEISWEGKDTEEEAMEDIKKWMDRNAEKLSKAKVGTVIVWTGKSTNTLNQ